MCQKLDPITKNAYGEIYFCNSCLKYHILFNNFHFILHEKELYSLKSYLLNIDVCYWENQFEGTHIKRRIPIPTYQENLILIFDRCEFEAFKDLLFNDSNNYKILSIKEIDFSFVMN